MPNFQVQDFCQIILKILPNHRFAFGLSQSYVHLGGVRVGETIDLIQLRAIVVVSPESKWEPHEGHSAKENEFFLDFCFREVLFSFPSQLFYE